VESLLHVDFLSDFWIKWLAPSAINGAQRLAKNVGGIAHTSERLNGCRVEALQLRSIEKIERALVLYMVVAWRITALMRLGRSCPDMGAQVMFEPDEWKAAYILNKLPPPQSPPKLNDVVRLVARLGGFLARKGDGEPGVKTIWEGMQRIFDAVIAMEYSRQLQAVGRCV